MNLEIFILLYEADITGLHHGADFPFPTEPQGNTGYFTLQNGSAGIDRMAVEYNE